MRGKWRSLLLAGALTAMSLSGAGVVTPAQAEQQTPARHTVTYDQHSVLVDGKPTGGVNRLPKAGEIRSNLAVGGKGAATELTPRELEICAKLGPELAKRGLVFVGIDVIAGYLTEINVTSPTGIVAIDAFNGTDTPGLIWDAIETRHAKL